MSNPFDDKGKVQAGAAASDAHVVYICEHCGERFDTLKSMAGQLVECPHCKKETLIASADDQVKEQAPLARPVDQPDSSNIPLTSSPKAPEPLTGNNPSSNKLMQCPDCDTTVSKRAETCPKCGVRLQPRVGVFAIVFWGTISFFVTVFLLGGLYLVLEIKFPDHVASAKEIFLNPREALLIDEPDPTSDPLPSEKTPSGASNGDQQETVLSPDASVAGAKPPSPPPSKIVEREMDDSKEKPTGKTVKFSELLASAEAGNKDSQHAVALLYLDDSVPVYDVSKGALWHLKAAKNGHVESQFQTAFLYFNGLGFSEDLEQAYLWALIAEKSGHPKGKELRTGLEAPELNITAARRHALKQLADAWKPE